MFHPACRNRHGMQPPSYIQMLRSCAVLCEAFKENIALLFRSSGGGAGPAGRMSSAGIWVRIRGRVSWRNKQCVCSPTGVGVSRRVGSLPAQAGPTAHAQFLNVRTPDTPRQPHRAGARSIFHAGKTARASPRPRARHLPTPRRPPGCPGGAQLTQTTCSLRAATHMHARTLGAMVMWSSLLLRMSSTATCWRCSSI